MAARSTGSRRSPSATRSRSGRSGSASSAPEREVLTMAAPSAAGLRAVGREPRRFRVMPVLRGRELGLLVVVAIALYVGSVSLGATQRLQEQLLEGTSKRIDVSTPADAGLLLIYLGALFLVHAALVVAGRRTDQLLLPTAG